MQYAAGRRRRFWGRGRADGAFLSPPPAFRGRCWQVRRCGGTRAGASLHALGFSGMGDFRCTDHYYVCCTTTTKRAAACPRTLLYPVFGDRAINGPIGWIADASCIIAVVAGNSRPDRLPWPAGFVGLSALFGIPDVFVTQALVIVGLVTIYTLSAVSGINRGISCSAASISCWPRCCCVHSSRRSDRFIFSNYFNGLGTYLAISSAWRCIAATPASSVIRAGWVGGRYFLGLVLGYGPLMAMFIARVSRGRSIRSIIVHLSIVAPIVTTFWFTIVGGTGLGMEIANPDSVARAFEGFNSVGRAVVDHSKPAARLPHLGAVPDSHHHLRGHHRRLDDLRDLGGNVEPGSLSGRRPCVLGSGNGRHGHDLIYTGSGGIGKLQKLHCGYAAVPVSLILLPSLWDAARITLLKGREGRPLDRRCNRRRAPEALCAELQNPGLSCSIATVPQHPDVHRRHPETVMKLARIGAFHQSRLSFMRQLLRRKRETGCSNVRRGLSKAPAWGVRLYRDWAGALLQPGRLRSRSRPVDALRPRYRHRLGRDFTLFDGVPTEADLDRLEANVPKQEAGRISSQELCLGAPTARYGCSIMSSKRSPGRQPDMNFVEEVGYLMRTTAVSPAAANSAHPIATGLPNEKNCRSFQAEMLTVFLIRAFTLDLVEHLARTRAPQSAVAIEPHNRRRFGVGQLHRAGHGAVPHEPPGAAQQLGDGA